MNTFQQQSSVETRLCTAVNIAVQAHDAEQLRQIVLIEPPFPPDHEQLIQSLQENWPDDDDEADDQLEELIKRVVPETAESEDDDGRPIQSWSSMVTFLIDWMAFLRDVDPNNLLEVYEALSDLLT
jgi:hypothetical protein